MMELIKKINNYNTKLKKKFGLWYIFIKILLKLCFSWSVPIMSLFQVQQITTILFFDGDIWDLLYAIVITAIAIELWEIWSELQEESREVVKNGTFS